MKTLSGVPAPKDAEYPHVPTPKELELSRQVVDLQQEKDAIELKLMAQIQDLESQTHKLQVRIHDLSQQLQTTKREQMHREQEAVECERAMWKQKVDELQRELDQEKNDKEAQKRWRTKFTEESVTTTSLQQQPTSERELPVEPLEDALAKFAQSIALLPARTAPKAAQAGVLPFLVHLLRENFSDVVTGSVLLALVHLAIYHKPKRVSRYNPQAIFTARSDAVVNVKEEIIKAGAAAPLAHILEKARNQRVLTEAARLCAALSSFVPNKRVLAAKNTVRFLIYMLVPGAFARNSLSPEDDRGDDALLDTERLEKVPIETIPELQRFALSALVNLSHDSEIIRAQIVNFHFVPTVVRYLRESADVCVQAEAAKLLGNLAFNHVVNQSAILTAEADAWLAKRLTAESLAKSRSLVRACAIGVGNLAYTSVSQLSIGYGDAMTFLLQNLVDSTDPLVLEAAAVALSGMCHLSPLNKGRAAAQNGIQVLLYVISRSKRYDNDEDALIAALECFCVLARPKPARARVFELDGHLPICQLCKKSKSAPLLIASAMALAVLIPTPLERHLLVIDSKESKLETGSIGLSSLKRVRHTVYGKEGSAAVPLWLDQAIARLASYVATTSGVTPESGGIPPDEDDPVEFHERSYYSMESLTEIEPDELCPGFYDA